MHDLADFVTAEAQRCGGHVVDFLLDRDTTPPVTVPVEAGANMKYVTPNRCAVNRNQHFFMRSLVIREKGELVVSQGSREVRSRKLSYVRPAEMISTDLDAETTGLLKDGVPLTFSLR